MLPQSVSSGAPQVAGVRFGKNGKFLHTISIGGRSYEVESEKPRLEPGDLRAIASRLDPSYNPFEPYNPRRELARQLGIELDEPALKPHPTKKNAYVGEIAIGGQRFQVESPKPQLDPEEWRRIRAKLGDPNAIRWENEARQVSQDRRMRARSAPLPQLAASSFVSAAVGRLPRQMRTPETMAAIARTAKALKENIARSIEKRAQFGAGAKFPWEDVGSGDEGEFARKLRRNMIAAASEIQAIDALARIGVVTPELAYRRLENERRLKTYGAQLQSALSMRGEAAQQRLDRKWTVQDVLEAVGDLADDPIGVLPTLLWSSGVLPAIAKGGIADIGRPSFWARAASEAKNYRGAQREMEGILGEWDAANPALAVPRQLGQAAGKIAGIVATGMAGAGLAGRAAGWLASKTGSRVASAVAKTFGLAPAKTVLGKIGQAGLYQLTVGYPNLAFSAWKTHDETYRILKEQGVGDDEARQIAMSEGIKELQPWLPIFDPNTHVGHKVESAAITALMLAGLGSGARRAVEANPAFQRAYVNAKMPFLRGERLSRLHTETLYTLLRNDAAVRDLWGLAPRQDARAELARVVGEDLGRFRTVVDAMAQRLTSGDGLQGLLDYLGAVRIKRQTPNIAPREEVPSARTARSADEPAGARRASAAPPAEQAGVLGAAPTEAAAAEAVQPGGGQAAMEAVPPEATGPEIVGPELPSDAQVHYWNGAYRILQPEQAARIDAIQAQYESMLRSADARRRRRLLADRRRMLASVYESSPMLPLRHTLLETISSLTPDLILRMEGPETFSMIAPRGEATRLSLQERIDIGERDGEGPDPLSAPEYAHLTPEQKQALRHARGEYEAAPWTRTVRLSPEGPQHAMEDVIRLAAGESGSSFAERTLPALASGELSPERLAEISAAKRAMRAGASDFLHEVVHHLESIGAIPEDSAVRIAKWWKARRENPGADGAETARIARSMPDEAVGAEDVEAAYNILASQIAHGLRRPGAELGEGVVGKAVRFVKSLARHLAETLSEDGPLWAEGPAGGRRGAAAERRYLEEATGGVAGGLMSGELLAAPPRPPRGLDEGLPEGMAEAARPFPVGRGDDAASVASRLWARSDPEGAELLERELASGHNPVSKRAESPTLRRARLGPGTTEAEAELAVRKAVLDSGTAGMHRLDVVDADGTVAIGDGLFADLASDGAERVRSMAPHERRAMRVSLGEAFLRGGRELREVGRALNALYLLGNVGRTDVLAGSALFLPEARGVLASSPDLGTEAFEVFYARPEDVGPTTIRRMGSFSAMLLEQLAEGRPLEECRLVPVCFPDSLRRRAHREGHARMAADAEGPRNEAAAGADPVRLVEDLIGRVRAYAEGVAAAQKGSKGLADRMAAEHLRMLAEDYGSAARDAAYLMAKHHRSAAEPAAYTDVPRDMAFIPTAASGRPHASAEGPVPTEVPDSLRRGGRWSRRLQTEAPMFSKPVVDTPDGPALALRRLAVPLLQPRDAFRVHGLSGNEYTVREGSREATVSVRGRFLEGATEELLQLTDLLRREFGDRPFALRLERGTEADWRLHAAGYVREADGSYRLMREPDHSATIAAEDLDAAIDVLNTYAPVDPHAAATYVAQLEPRDPEARRLTVRVHDVPRADGKLGEIVDGSVATPVYKRPRRYYSAGDPIDLDALEPTDPRYQPLVDFMVERLTKAYGPEDVKTIEDLRYEELYDDLRDYNNVTNISAESFGRLVRRAWREYRSQLRREHGGEHADAKVLEQSFRIMSSQFTETDVSRMTFLPETSRRWGQDVNPQTPFAELKRQWVEERRADFMRRFFKDGSLHVPSVEEALREYFMFADRFKALVDRDGITVGATKMSALSLEDEATVQAAAAVLMHQKDKLERQISYLEEDIDREGDARQGRSRSTFVRGERFATKSAELARLRSDLERVESLLDQTVEVMEISGRIGGTYLASRRVKSLTDLNLFLDVGTYKRMTRRAMRARGRQIPESLERSFDLIQLWEESMNLKLRCQAIREEVEREVLRRLQGRGTDMRRRGGGAAPENQPEEAQAPPQASERQADQPRQSGGGATPPNQPEEAAGGRAQGGEAGQPRQGGGEAGQGRSGRRRGGQEGGDRTQPSGGRAAPQEEGAPEGGRGRSGRRRRTEEPTRPEAEDPFADEFDPFADDSDAVRTEGRGGRGRRRRTEERTRPESDDPFADEFDPFADDSDAAPTGGRGGRGRRGRRRGGDRPVHFGENVFEEYKTLIERLENLSSEWLQRIQSSVDAGELMPTQQIAELRSRIAQVNAAIDLVRSGLASGERHARWLAWSEEYERALAETDRSDPEAVRRLEEMERQLAEEFRQILYIGPDETPDIDEILQSEPRVPVPGEDYEQPPPTDESWSGLADEVVRNTRSVLRSSVALNDLTQAHLILRRLFGMRDALIRLNRGDERYFNEWLERQRLTRETAEAVERSRTPGAELSAVEKLRVLMVKESEMLQIARTLDNVRRRIALASGAPATEIPEEAVGARRPDVSDLHREERLNLRQFQQILNVTTGVTRALGVLREAVAHARDNRIDATQQNVETMLKSEEFLQKLGSLGIDKEEFAGRLRDAAVLNRVAQAVRDQLRYTKEIEEGLAMPGTARTLPVDPESEEYRRLDAYLRDNGVEGGVEEAAQIIDEARQRRTQAKLWREIRELGDILGESLEDFDVNRAIAALERGAVPFEPNLETRKLLEQKRELRAHLEWLINHLQGQNIVEEVRGIYRALIYTALSNRLIDFFSTLFRTGTFVTFGWLDHYFERLVWSLQRAPRTDFAIESASMTVPPVDFLRTVTTLPRAAAAVRDAYRATVWPYFKEMFLRLVTGKKHANIEFKAAKEFLQQPSEKFGASSWTTLHAHVKGEHLPAKLFSNILMRADSMNAMFGGFTQLPDITFGEFVNAYATDRLARSAAREMLKIGRYAEKYGELGVDGLAKALITGQINGEEARELIPHHLYVLHEAAKARTDISFMAPSLEYEKMFLMGHLKTKKHGKVPPEAPNLKEEAMSLAKLLFDWVITPFPRMMWRLAGWATDYHGVLGPLKMLGYLLHRKLVRGTKGVPLSPYERYVVARKIRRWLIGQGVTMFAAALADRVVDEEGMDKEPSDPLLRYFVGRWDPNAERFVFEPLPVLRDIPVFGSAMSVASIGGPFQLYEWAFSAQRFKRALELQKNGVVVLGGKTYKAEDVAPIVGRIYAKAFMQSMLAHPMIQKTLNIFGAMMGRGDLWTELGKLASSWWPGFLRHELIRQDVSRGIYTRRPQGFLEGVLSKMYPFHSRVPFNGVGRIFGAGDTAQLEFQLIAYDPQEEGGRIVGDEEKALLKAVGKPAIETLVRSPLWDSLLPYRFIPGTLGEDESVPTRRTIAKETVAGIRGLVKLGLQAEIPTEDLVTLANARFFFQPVELEKADPLKGDPRRVMALVATSLAHALRTNPDLAGSINPLLAPRLAYIIQRLAEGHVRAKKSDPYARRMRNALAVIAVRLYNASIHTDADLFSLIPWRDMIQGGLLNAQTLEELKRITGLIEENWREARSQAGIPEFVEEAPRTAEPPSETP